MRRALTDAASLTVLGGIALAFVAFVEPAHTALAVDAYLLFLGALALSVLTRATREGAGTGESELESRLRRRRRRSSQRGQLPELARVEREVSLASASAFDLHVRLRPTLREVAAHRLISRHGVGLDDQPARAERLLGPETWELVRPDRVLPEDRHAPGISLTELDHVVDSLERL